ncbi:MAG: hypothetical protein FWF38_01400 [Spirochaetaceae bacterium]|nr:hypothetical protein [Spirochaetaceae bacterium]
MRTAVSRLDFFMEWMLRVEKTNIVIIIKIVDILDNFISNPIRLVLLFIISLPYIMPEKPN